MFARQALSYQAIPLPDRADLTDAEMAAEAETFLARMRRRHTVRDYAPRPVPRAVIETCIRTAGTAMIAPNTPATRPATGKLNRNGQPMFISAASV